MSQTIVDEILSYDLPDSIKTKALQIYDQIKDKVGTCRSSIRRQLLYFLIHNAYMELDEIPIQTEIVQLVKVDDSSISKALKEFSWPRTSYRMRSDNTTVQDLLSHHARDMGIREDAIANLIEQSKIWTNHPDLKRKPVTVVTAAVIKYYMDISGLHTDWNQITQKFNRSKVVIDDAYCIISSIDNS